MNFDEAFERVIGVEAGFTKDPKDPGNWTSGRVGVGRLVGTKYGIAAATYGATVDIPNLTLAQAKGIYYEDWWLAAGGDVLDPAILYQLWDFAINAGMSTAKRLLQRVADVPEDGMIGPRTLAAVQALDKNDLLFRYNAAKIRYYTSLLTWPTYGKGWMNRTATNLDYCAQDNTNLPKGVQA